MTIKEFFQKIEQAVIDLDEDALEELITQAIEEGVPPIDLIVKGMGPGLDVVGDGYAKSTRFMADLVVAGDIMIEAVDKLRPLLESGGSSLGETMVIGTVQGDIHYVGKRVVGAIFTGGGYNVIDIGENLPASAFVEAAIKHKATVVGASAILSPAKSYCKVIADALTEAGIRDDIIYVAGGTGITPEYAHKLGADCSGENAVAGLEYVNKIRSEKLKKLKDQ